MSINREPATAAMSAPSSAVGVCEDLIAWYGKYAARARDRYRVLEVALLIVGASISVAALAWPGNGVPAALLGGVVVVLTGLRQVFHWQENFVRFTWAYQTLKQERRRYDVGEPPYDDPTLRDRRLMEVVNTVEARENQGWAELLDSKTGKQSKK
jgi:Protein of unknown function (DUF4231)